jgi:DNA modification methylase
LQKLDTYKNLNSFHKYWGKKSLEHYSFLVDNFSHKNDIVLEPFLGSGLVTKLILDKERKFVGIDINPISIEMAKLFVDLPDLNSFKEAFYQIEENVKVKIESSYKTEKNKVGSHYLWQENNLLEVWYKDQNKRVTSKARKSDHELINSFSNKTFAKFNQLPFFINSRVGVSKHTNIYSFFTKRALSNIEHILKELNTLDPKLKRTFQLILSSNLGQMSKMVFAIKRRSDSTKSLSRYEVGSWAIGLWRPKLHFEINVWNCFEIRVKRFIKTLENLAENNTYKISKNINLQKKDNLYLKTADAISEIKRLEDNSIDLIITDPPHSDRIPYLELSTLWNNILGFKNIKFQKEIVFSNSTERKKTSANYKYDISLFLKESLRVVKPEGLIAIMFNSSNTDDWNIFEDLKDNFIGMYDAEYSVSSLVQDNRNNSLKEDKVLIFSKNKLAQNKLKVLKKCNNWTTNFP